MTIDRCTGLYRAAGLDVTQANTCKEINKMKHPPKLNSSRQDGAALIVGLILLAVATIVTLLSMSSGHMQERMTSNTNNQAIAFKSAETGASEFWAWMRSDPGWESDDWQTDTDIPTSADEAINLGDHGYYWIDPDEVEWDSPEPDLVSVVVRGHARVGDDAVGEQKVRVTFSRGQPQDVHPAFSQGLLSDQDIEINGNADLYGSAHANGMFEATGGNSGLFRREVENEDGEMETVESTVSAGGEVDLRGDIQGTLASDSPTVDVPSAKEYIDEFRAEGHEVVETCEDIEGGDHGGTVYYCDGDIDTSGDIKNATILAEGDVEHGGASTLGEEGELEIMIVSGGDIIVNGSSATHGVFWAEGKVRKNGRADLGGAVIAGSGITMPGNFDYFQTDNFGDLDLPEGDPVGSQIAGWRDYLD